MMTDAQLAAYDDNYRALMRFSARYRADEALRARVENGDYRGLDAEAPPGKEIRVVCQTPDVYYLLMPEDPNQLVSDRALASVAGGTPAGSVSTVLTVGCVPSCISSGSTVGSVSSAGM